MQFGTGGANAGDCIRQNVPRLFAALVLITLAGVALYLAVSALAHVALAHWHESEIAPAE